MKGKPPSFQFYPTAWLSSKSILLMTPAEEGAYIRLLAHAWESEDCGLPDDDRALAILSRLGAKKWRRSAEKIRSCFFKHGDFLFNKRLLEEREKQLEHSRICSEKGVKSGISRNRGSVSVEPNSNQTPPTNTTPVEPDANSLSYSYSCTDISSDKNHSHPEADFLGHHNGVLVIVDECPTADDLLADVMNHDALTPSVKPKAAKPPPSVMASEFMAVWNEHCGSMISCRAMPAKRATHCAKRLESKVLRDAGLNSPADYIPLVQWLAQSAWHCGDNERGWRADIDFLIRSDEQPLKFLEKLADGGGGERQDPHDPFRDLPDSLSEIRAEREAFFAECAREDAASAQGRVNERGNSCDGPK